MTTIPENLSETQKKATLLLASHRGHFVVSQALYVAIGALQAEDEVGGAGKNSEAIADMQTLMALFPLYKTTQELAQAITAEGGDGDPS